MVPFNTGFYGRTRKQHIAFTLQEAILQIKSYGNYARQYTEGDMAKKGTRTFCAVKGLDRINAFTFTVLLQYYLPHECELYYVVWGKTLQNQSPKNIRCLLTNNHSVTIIVIQTTAIYHATPLQGDITIILFYCVRENHSLKKAP